jgi:hypothetical protein
MLKSVSERVVSVFSAGRSAADSRASIVVLKRLWVPIR